MRCSVFYTETVIRFNTLHPMKHPLAFRQKLFAALLSVAVLPACTSMSTGWNKTVSTPESDLLIFSHATSPSPSRKVPQSYSNNWSPTQWSHVTSQTEERTPKAAVETSIVLTQPPTLTVYFANDSHLLNSEELDRLKVFAATLTSGVIGRVEVTGHTDSVQTPVYNMALSQRRARTVQQWLVQLGIPENRLVLVWKGLHLPVSSNATDEGRASNRRVEIKLVPVEGTGK